MSDVCREFGISRKTGCKILHGLFALSERSRALCQPVAPDPRLGLRTRVEALSQRQLLFIYVRAAHSQGSAMARAPTTARIFRYRG
jgi:hypothetical protein